MARTKQTRRASTQKSTGEPQAKKVAPKPKVVAKKVAPKPKVVAKKAVVASKTATKKTVVAPAKTVAKKAVVAKKKTASSTETKVDVEPEVSGPNYSGMKVVELRDLLEKRNLSTTGLKKALITRLEYWDGVLKIKGKVTLNKDEDTPEYSIIIHLRTENDEKLHPTVGDIRDLLDVFGWKEGADIKKGRRSSIKPAPSAPWTPMSDWEIIWPAISKDIAEDRATELEGATFLHYVVDSVEVKKLSTEIKPKWSMIPTAADGLKRKISEKDLEEKRTATEKLVAGLHDVRTIYSADYIIIGSWSLLEDATKYVHPGAYVHLGIADIKEIMKITELELAFVDTEGDDDPEIKKTEKQISKLIKNPSKHDHVKKAFRTIAESKKLEIRDFRSQVVVFHNDYGRNRGVLEIMEYIAQKRPGWLSRGNPSAIHTFAVEKEINEDLEDYVPGASLNHNVVFFSYND